jgi:hypothetical protein
MERERRNNGISKHLAQTPIFEPVLNVADFASADHEARGSPHNVTVIQRAVVSEEEGEHDAETFRGLRLKEIRRTIAIPYCFGSPWENMD